MNKNRQPGGAVSVKGQAQAPARGEREQNFASIFEALGESTRLEIMQLLPRQAVCRDMYNVVELAEELGLTQPTVSHHLKILREARLVKCRRQCNSLYFYVNQPAVRQWMVETKRRFGCG